MAKPDSQWYRLDNAGILYSALQREEYSAIYRFSALMTEPVRPAALQNAIDRVLPRFPSFAVRIRRGLFWYYLEPNTAPGPFLKADVANPCQPVRLTRKSFRPHTRFCRSGERVSETLVGWERKSAPPKRLMTVWCSVSVEGNRYPRIRPSPVRR